MIKTTKVSDDAKFLQHYCDKCNIETICYGINAENKEERVFEHVCPSCKTKYYEKVSYPHVIKDDNK